MLWSTPQPSKCSLAGELPHLMFPSYDPRPFAQPPKRKILFFGPEISWTFPGNVQEFSWKFPGNFVDISWTFPGHFLEIFRTFPGKPWSKTWPKIWSKIWPKTCPKIWGPGGNVFLPPPVWPKIKKWMNHTKCIISTSVEYDVLPMHFFNVLYTMPRLVLSTCTPVPLAFRCVFCSCLQTV